MIRPAKYGVLVYSSDIKKLSEFYIELFSMHIIRETNDFISLAVEGFNVIIHHPPAVLPKSDFNTVKLFLTVDSLAKTKKRAVELGGQAFDDVWSNPIFSVCNITDSDGNYIQLREFSR